MYRLLNLLGMGALALSIYGGSTADSTDPTKQKNSNTFRHIGIILFVVLYVLLALLHVRYWIDAKSLMRNRKSVRIVLLFQE